jgi:hypothetical protein
MDLPLGWAQQFQSLVEADPPEILIWDHTRFESCAIFSGNPCDCGMSHAEDESQHWNGRVVWTDLEFWFPCADPFHRGCGFFEWTLCLETAEFRRKCLEDGEERSDSWDFVIVDAPIIEEKNLPEIARRWLERWVPQLAPKPIRLVSYEESRRIWARFEEMHPDAEQEDVMHVCQQRLVAIENGTVELVPIDEIRREILENGDDGDAT